MSVEKYNPYTRDTVVVTSSLGKQRLCKETGLRTERNGLKVDAVAYGERQHDLANGHGVLVYHGVNNPYSLRVVQAKARALIERHSGLIGEPHAVTDSVWLVPKDEQISVSLNKPATEPDIDQIVTLIDASRGRPLVNQTSVAVVKPNLDLELYIFNLSMGAINPAIDLTLIRNVISHNTHIAGGFDVTLALKHGIVSPRNPFFHFTVERVDDIPDIYIADRRGRQIGGSIITKRQYQQEIGNDAANQSWIKKIALGFLPPK